MADDLKAGKLTKSYSPLHATMNMDNNRGRQSQVVSILDFSQLVSIIFLLTFGFNTSVQ